MFQLFDGWIRKTSFVTSSPIIKFFLFPILFSVIVNTGNLSVYGLKNCSLWEPSMESVLNIEPIQNGIWRIVEIYLWHCWKVFILLQLVFFFLSICNWMPLIALPFLRSSMNKILGMSQNMLTKTLTIYIYVFDHFGHFHLSLTTQLIVNLTMEKS